MKNLFCIKDKVIAITGGYGILGACISKYLAQQGGKVVVLGRNKEKGNALIKEIRDAGNVAVFLEGDVLSKASLEKNKQEIADEFGTLDILINAAGGNMAGATIPPDKSFLDLQTDDLEQVMKLNFMGTVLPISILSSLMIDAGAGNIINFSSLSALRPLTRVVGYAAAKAAVSNYTKYMAAELARKYGERFRVNALVPGFFITEQNRTLLTNADGTYTDRGKTILAHTPFGRFGEPEELLGSIHYLASDASKFVTGTLLVVDGGFDAFSI